MRRMQEIHPERGMLQQTNHNAKACKVQPRRPIRQLQKNCKAGTAEREGTDMSTWKIVKTGKMPKIQNPALIEGLPGIGNVGKVAIDFIIEELKADKIYELESNHMPNSVFVNEQNLIELPTISVYHKKADKRDILLVGGDAQQIDEPSTYDFSETVLDILKSFDGNEIITLGGIGLPTVPKSPKVYCTGTSKEFIEKYAKGTTLNPNLYGIVGPIMGASGILLGLAKRRNINAISFLAETYGHPMYLGIRGAREIVRIINNKFSLGIRISQLDKEIRELEEEAARTTKAALPKAMRGLQKGSDAS